jgi:dTDP-4-dehydrorhamnose 3,5-epimerase-like enzyme
MSLINFVKLPELGDERGKLVAIEENQQIPFAIKRVYYIYGTKTGVARGYHAHKELNQLAVCVSGKCKIVMDNGLNKKDIWLDNPATGIIIPPMVWHEMQDFSEDCVLLVLASEHYDESDYIRNYETFIESIKA